MNYGAGFYLLRDNANKGASKVPISSQTVLIGDLLQLSVGAANWTVATSSSINYTRKAVALEAATSSDTEVLVLILDGTEDFQVQSANNSSASDNGDRMALTDKNTVNNSGTDVTTAVVGFLQRGVVGATSDKQIWGNVLVGNGVTSTV